MFTLVFTFCLNLFELYRTTPSFTGNRTQYSDMCRPHTFTPTRVYRRHLSNVVIYFD